MNVARKSRAAMRKAEEDLEAGKSAAPERKIFLAEKYIFDIRRKGEAIVPSLHNRSGSVLRPNLRPIDTCDWFGLSADPRRSSAAASDAAAVDR